MLRRSKPELKSRIIDLVRTYPGIGRTMLATHLELSVSRITVLCEELVAEGQITGERKEIAGWQYFINLRGA